MPTLLVLFETWSPYLSFKSILKVEGSEDFKQIFPCDLGNPFSKFYSREIKVCIHKSLHKKINSNFI